MNFARNLYFYLTALSIFLVLGFFVTGYWLICLILILIYIGFLRMVYVDDQERIRAEEISNRREMRIEGEDGNEGMSIDIQLSHIHDESFIEEHSVKKTEKIENLF